MHEYKQWVKLPVMARLLSRSIKQFRDDVGKYNIPHIKLGRDKLFDPERVTNYLSDKSQTIAQSVLVQSLNVDLPAKNSRKIKSETIETEHYKALLGLQ